MHSTSLTPVTPPRLPVLSWRYFLDRRKSSLPSVLDSGRVLPTTSGRAAIALALRLAGCRAGDRVLVPTYHCPTMVAPIVALGATPVFYPISATGEAAPENLPAGVADGCRAIIAPHYFGIPRRMSRIRAYCDESGIALIEDCAHAFFGVAEGRSVGSWGDYAIASLTKFFPVSEGGCLVTRSPKLASLRLGSRPVGAELRAVADALELGVAHGRLAGINVLLAAAFRAKRAVRSSAANGAAPAAEHSGDAMQRAVTRACSDFSEGALPFRRIARAVWALVGVGGQGRIVARRQDNYRWLARRLAHLSNAHPLGPDCPDGAAPYVFPLWVRDPEAVYQKIRASGVPVFRWDDRWPDTPELSNDSGDEWARHVFQIGCHQDLEAPELEWIARTLEQLIDGDRTA